MKNIEDEHKELKDLCKLVADCREAGMSSEEIVREIIKKYGFYLHHKLTYEEYVAWLRSDRKFAHIYFQVVAQDAYEELLDLGGIQLL